VAGVTAIVTTAATTVTVVVALFPSDVAVIVAVPPPMALISPVDDTLAMFELDDDHVMVRPNSALPLASSGVAVRCAVEPTGIEAVDDAIVTEFTAVVAVVTVIVATAEAPSLDAMIVVVPAATAVTRPLDDTVTTPVFDDVHAAGRANSVVPSAASVVAVNCAVVPTVIEPMDGVSETDATAGVPGVTVTSVEPDLPSLVAVMIAVPDAIPMATP
jgi:hypothetical protein